MPTSSRDRAYSAPPALASLGMGYGWSPTYVNTGGGANSVTGGWIPINVTDSGSLSVNIGGLTFTGNLEVDNAGVISAVGSGNAYLAAISGELINGQLSITGNLGVIITGISSSVSITTNNTGAWQTSILSGYTGISTNARLSATAVILSGYAPNFISGSNATAAIDSQGGGLLVAQADLNSQFDSVTIQYPQVSTVSNTTPSGSLIFTGAAIVTGQVLASNTGRQLMYIANVSTVQSLYVRLGVGAVSTGAFNIILNPSPGAGQQGGFYSDERWKGAVQISGGPFMAWEY